MGSVIHSCLKCEKYILFELVFMIFIYFVENLDSCYFPWLVINYIESLLFNKIGISIEFSNSHYVVTFTYFSEHDFSCPISLI